MHATCMSTGDEINFASFAKLFAKNFQVFVVFVPFPDFFERFRMRLDVFGCVRMCSDAFRCIWIRSDAFGHFWEFQKKTWTKLRFFADFNQRLRSYAKRDGTMKFLAVFRFMM